MARTCLVFDTAANISNNQFDDVYVIPLLITEVIDGKIKTYRDGVDIDGKTCLEKLIAGQCLKTAQSIPKDVVDLMDKLSVEYDEVFFIPCPLQISNQYNSMKLICADYKNVHVFKQNMLANFTLWTLEDLLDLNKKGKLTADYIQKYLDETQFAKAGVLNVPDFRYLKRGGRVSAFKAAMGSLLKFKVSISYADSGLVMFDKTTNIKKIPAICEESFKAAIPNFSMSKINRIWFGTSGISDEKFKIDEIMALMKKYFKVDKKVKVYEGPITSVITAHTGPNYVIVGVGCDPKVLKINKK